MAWTVAAKLGQLSHNTSNRQRLCSLFRVLGAASETSSLETRTFLANESSLFTLWPSGLAKGDRTLRGRSGPSLARAFQICKMRSIWRSRVQWKELPIVVVLTVRACYFMVRGFGGAIGSPFIKCI